MIRKPYRSPVAGLSRVHEEAANRPANQKRVDAICCDCEGTLYDHNGIDKTLVAYLNARHEAGEMVVIFSSNWSQVFDRVQETGLHPAILRTLKDKRECHGMHVTEYIDDAPSSRITAGQVFHPKDHAFRRYIQVYLDSTKPGLSAPQPRG